MAVSLGRTISNPAFLLFQIVHGVSLFLLLLGVSRVALGVAEVYGRARPAATAAPAAAYPLAQAGLGKVVELRSGSVALPLRDARRRVAAVPTSASPPFVVQLSYCFHVPLASLFDSPVDVDAGAGASPAAAAAGGMQARPVLPTAAPLPAGAVHAVTATSVSTTVRDGSIGRFYVQHVSAALLCAYPLAALLQRRKFVLDFVLTIYAAYFILANVVLRRVWGGGPHWWGACVIGLLLMYGATYALCRRKELQEVRLSGGAGAAAAGAAVPPTAVWVAEDSGAPAEEMRVMPRDPSPRETTGRARTPFPGPSGKGPRSVAEELSDGSEVMPKHK